MTKKQQLRICSLSEDKKTKVSGSEYANCIAKRFLPPLLFRFPAALSAARGPLRREICDFK
jgi:hypothetical protein